jgi:hypothetical protein
MCSMFVIKNAHGAAEVNQHLSEHDRKFEEVLSRLDVKRVFGFNMIKGNRLFWKNPFIHSKVFFSVLFVRIHRQSICNYFL